MGLGFEIIWPGKPDCEQGAMYERENLGQFRLMVLAGAIPACSSSSVKVVASYEGFIGACNA